MATCHHATMSHKSEIFYTLVLIRFLEINPVGNVIMLTKILILQLQSMVNLRWDPSPVGL